MANWMLNYNYHACMQLLPYCDDSKLLYRPSYTFNQNKNLYIIPGEAEQGGHLPLQFLQSLHRIIIFLHTNMSWYHILPPPQILAVSSVPVLYTA